MPSCWYWGPCGRESTCSGAQRPRPTEAPHMSVGSGVSDGKRLGQHRPLRRDSGVTHWRGNWAHPTGSNSSRTDIAGSPAITGQQKAPRVWSQHFSTSDTLLLLGLLKQCELWACHTPSTRAVPSPGHRPLIPLYPCGQIFRGGSA